MSCIPNTRCPKWKCIFMYFLCIQKETVHNSSSTENIVRLCVFVDPVSLDLRAPKTRSQLKPPPFFRWPYHFGSLHFYRESSLENPLLWLKIFCLISNTALQILPYFWNIKTVYFYKLCKSVFINYQILNVKKVYSWILTDFDQDMKEM